MPNIGGGFAQFGGGVAQAVAAVRLPLVGAAAARRGVGQHASLPEHGRDLARPARPTRSSRSNAGPGYAYRLTVESPAAKEVRLFGLADWIVGGFTSLRRQLLDLSWAERRLRRAGDAVGDRHRRRRERRCSSGRWAATRATATSASARSSCSRRPRSVRARSRSATGTGGCARARNRSRSCSTSPTAWARPARWPSGRADAAGHAAARDPVRGRAVRVPDERPARARRLRPHDPGRAVARDRRPERRGEDDARQAAVPHVRPDRGRDPSSTASTCASSTSRRGASRIAAVFQDYVRYELTLRDNVAPAGAPSDDDVARRARAGARRRPRRPRHRAVARLRERPRPLGRAVAAGRAGARVVRGAARRGRRHPRRADRAARRARRARDLRPADRRDARRTTILISHRFSTVRRADLICVVEGGRVVELGSHDELIARGGRYKTMFELQASRFGDDRRRSTGALESDGRSRQ